MVMFYSYCHCEFVVGFLSCPTKLLCADIFTCIYKGQLMLGSPIYVIQVRHSIQNGEVA